MRSFEPCHEWLRHVLRTNGTIDSMLLHNIKIAAAVLLERERYLLDSTVCILREHQSSVRKRPSFPGLFLALFAATLVFSYILRVDWAYLACSQKRGQDVRQDMVNA